MALVINGIDVDISGTRTVSWKQDGAFALAIPNDGRPRRSPVTAITLHTTEGKLGPVRPGFGAQRDLAKRNATYWRRSDTHAGAHLLVDTDGLVACTCDLATTTTYHAGSVNEFTVGIEICQARGAVLYAEQLQVVVRLVDFLTATFGIQRQIPLPYKRRLKRLAEHGRSFVGVFGHRDQTSSRGRGDPGDAIFELLAAAGYERFDLEASQDIEVWKARQRALGMPEAQVDGVPDARTRAFLVAAGYPDGLWVRRPPFVAPASPALESVAKAEPVFRRSLPSEFEFMGDLVQGEKGARVKLLQELLVLAGQRVGLDGSFGPATRSAVETFQRGVSAPATGVVDAQTWALLSAPFARANRAVTAGPLGATVVRVAEQHLAEHPVEVGGENRGPWVRLYTDGKDGAGYPWCAAFATSVVRQAAQDVGVAMPVKRTLGCDEIALHAKKNKLFVEEAELASGAVEKRAIEPGSLFLVRRTSTDWTHTGIVVRAGDDAFETIEGNTNDDGSWEGYEVCRRHRDYRGIDFVRLTPR